jgi:hypothetical protein
VKKIKWIIIILSVIIGGVLGIYFSKFHNGLSGNSDDWGNFGDYIGGVGCLVLSYALLWFTYRADKREEEVCNRHTAINNDKVEKWMIEIPKSLSM